ncbi:MAG: DUF3037 domain-containing protein [Chloroflexia bacterium]|nr:DUF3037 domain-containing protein [Chloroflexia bacterium]
MSEVAPAAYFYTVLRVVPRVDRGECINAGVVLFSRSLRYLGMRWALDPWKLEALSANTDPDFVESQLAAMAAVATGAADGGPMAQMERAERFHWLAAPSSTMIQPSPVHTGVTADPEATLDRLFTELVG